MSAPKKRAPAKPKKTPVKAKKKKVTALKTPKVLSTALQKKLVAEAVGRSFGKITPALQKLEEAGCYICRNTYYRWLRSDPKFKEAVEEAVAAAEERFDQQAMTAWEELVRTNYWPAVRHRLVAKMGIQEKLESDVNLKGNLGVTLARAISNLTAEQSVTNNDTLERNSENA